MDCEYNSEGMCNAPQISLDYGENGGCECLSYTPMGMGAEGGLIEDAAMMGE